MRVLSVWVIIGAFIAVAGSQPLLEGSDEEKVSVYERDTATLTRGNDDEVIIDSRHFIDDGERSVASADDYLGVREEQEQEQEQELDPV